MAGCMHVYNQLSQASCAGVRQDEAIELTLKLILYVMLHKVCPPLHKTGNFLLCFNASKPRPLCKQHMSVSLRHECRSNKCWRFEMHWLKLNSYTCTSAAWLPPSSSIRLSRASQSNKLASHPFSAHARADSMQSCKQSRHPQPPPGSHHGWPQTERVGCQPTRLMLACARARRRAVLVHLGWSAQRTGACLAVGQAPSAGLLAALHVCKQLSVTMLQQLQRARQLWASQQKTQGAN